MTDARRFLSAAIVALALVSPAHAGEVEPSLRMTSTALGRPLEFALYRPDGSTKGLPVVYLLHGRASNPQEWLRMGMVRQTADRLIAEGRIPRMLIVLPDAGNSWYVDTPPGAAGAVETAIAGELPKAIEKAYGTNANRVGRAVAGNSMGGFGALRFAFGHPERYVAAASMSGAFWTRIKPDTRVDPEMAERLARVFSGAFGTPFEVPRFLERSPMTLAARLPAGAPHPAIFLTASRGDRFRLAEEQDTVETTLRGLRYDVTSQVTEGDHDWGTWEAALPEVLLFLGRHLRAD